MYNKFFTLIKCVILSNSVALESSQIVESVLIEKRSIPFNASENL